MNTDIVKKYKNKSLSSLHKTAKEWFNKFIRLRDSDENGYSNCIATGQHLKYGNENCHAGHYFAGGKYKSLEFNEDNVHVQSKQDNYYGHDFAAYTMNLISKIGTERFEKLDFLARYEKQHGFKEDRFFYIEIIEKYKAKVKELARTKNFEVN